MKGILDLYKIEEKSQGYHKLLVKLFQREMIRKQFDVYSKNDLKQLIYPLIIFWSVEMEKLQFSIEIETSKEKVWNTLWEDKTFRDWANIIDEGMYKVGEMKEGDEVQFISAVNGYGVTSLIEKLIPNELVQFRHKMDTKESGEQERENEWTGGQESYSLKEHEGRTALTVKLDAPHEQVETFEQRFPKALERVKILAEKKD